MMSATGQSRYPSTIAAPALPSQLVPPLFAPSDMELWLDTSSAIGTTAITGRFISCELTIPTGVTYKWFASGPAGGLNFQAVGREKSHPEMKFVFEFNDLNQYNLYNNNSGDTVVKSRVQFNGPIIETTNRHYVQCDVYGPFDALAWGENAGSNRTLELTIMGEYDATLGSDLRVVVQNNSGTL
jgi:hypothetical protein